MTVLRDKYPLIGGDSGCRAPQNLTLRMHIYAAGFAATRLCLRFLQLRAYSRPTVLAVTAPEAV